MDRELRSNLIDADATCDDLVAAVMERVLETQKIEGLIRASWKSETAAVADNWDAEWHLMVPGADVLELLFQRHLARRYNNRTDGLVLAQAMQAPESLAQQLSPVFAP